MLLQNTFFLSKWVVTLGNPLLTLHCSLYHRCLSKTKHVRCVFFSILLECFFFQILLYLLKQVLCNNVHTWYHVQKMDHWYLLQNVDCLAQKIAFSCQTRFVEKSESECQTYVTT